MGKLDKIEQSYIYIKSRLITKTSYLETMQTYHKKSLELGKVKQCIKATREIEFLQVEICLITKFLEKFRQLYKTEIEVLNGYCGEFRVK